MQRLVWQDDVTKLDTYVDSDWAGCRVTCRSTSGGASMLGRHCIMAWSAPQTVMALSSGKAELYSIVKGATIKENSDGSAAIGIINKSGVGKLRHIRAQYLWLQEEVKEK